MLQKPLARATVVLAMTLMCASVVAVWGQEEKKGAAKTDPTKKQTKSAISVDAGLPSYKAVSGISGNLSSVGSDSMNNLMTLWAEQFNKFYPNVKIQVEGKGSGTAPTALIAGT